MPVFKWVGVGPQGQTIRGEMEAGSRQAVITRLRTQRIKPSMDRIKEKGKGLDREISLSLGNPVKQHDIVIFTRQFATMIDAGLPLVQCLDILSNQSDNKVLRKTIRNVKEEVEAGSTFAAALKKHPKVFSDLYANMVAAGEVGGILDTILNRLATYMEKIVRLKSKIKGAMIYPACIMAAAVLVTGILLVYVIPVFAELFQSFGQALPAPTQFVINLSNATIAYFWYIIAGTVAAAVALVMTARTDRGRYLLDRFSLRIPVFGDLIRKSAIARFARTLGHARLVGRADPGRADDHRSHRGQQDRRARDLCNAHEHQRRKNDRRTPHGKQGLSADGLSDDRGRRDDRRARSDAAEDRGLL